MSKKETIVVLGKVFVTYTDLYDEQTVREPTNMSIKCLELDGLEPSSLPFSYTSVHFYYPFTILIKLGQGRPVLVLILI